MINSFLLAFAMYSRVPMPGPDWEKEKMKYVMVFLPVVGAVVGAVFWGFGALCAYLSLPGLFRAAGLTAIPLVVTGGIHMDGFLDTADALASCQDRERKLEILKDSRTGAFAVIKGGLYLVCSLGVWSALPERLLPVAAVGFVFSRALAGMSTVIFRNARGTGLLATFTTAAEKRITRAALGVWILLSGGAMILIDPLSGCIAAAFGAAAFLYYRLKSYKEFGGITGDLAGWFIQNCELALGLSYVVSACIR